MASQPPRQGEVVEEEPAAGDSSENESSAVRPQSSDGSPQETTQSEVAPDEGPEDRGLRTESSVEDPQDEPEAPEDPVTVLQRERDEYLSLAQRTQADFENWRKRAAKEAAAASQRAKGGLVAELLPVLDNLERALASATENEEHLADGVRLVHSGLLGVLERNGVEVFDPAGERFDPSLHEAISTRPEEGAENGVVLDVVEKGYRLNGSVLRPARVVVSG